MEHLIPRTAWSFVLAALITMMMAGIVMVTAVNIAAATAVSRFVSSLDGPGPDVFVGTTVHLVAIPANRTTPSTRVESLVRRLNVLARAIPLILAVSICTIGALLYLAYRRWYRRLTSPHGPSPAPNPSPAQASSRRYRIQRIAGPLARNSQVTLPRYSPPPPSYSERAEHWEHVELA